MKIYWTLKQIPELRDLPKGERKRVWRDCYMTPKHMVIYVFVVVTVCFPLTWLINQAKMPTWTFAALSGLCAGIASFIVSQVQIERLRPSIREYLNEHEHIKMTF